MSPITIEELNRKVKTRHEHLKPMWDNPEKYPVVKEFKTYKEFFMFMQRVSDGLTRCQEAFKKYDRDVKRGLIKDE